MEDTQNSPSPSRDPALRPATSFLDRIGQPPAPHAEEHTVHKQISRVRSYFYISGDAALKRENELKTKESHILSV